MTSTVSPSPSNPPSLSFPASTFAKLSPHPYLLAHLTSANSKEHGRIATDSVRPNGRSCSEFRPPNINTGSLTHAEGSAVVRCGDTTAVAGVRAEILLAMDVPDHPVHNNGPQELQDLDLLVPNIELATGCSPQFLPGQPPSSLAQSLSTRVYSLLHSSHLIDVEDLKIWYHPPDELKSDDDMEDDEDVDEGGEEEEKKAVVKAYWTLYIDILFISLDGNPFDTAWAAAIAALRNVRLPHAHWDIDAETVLCSDLVSESKKLSLSGLPAACTYAIFATGSVLQENNGKVGQRQWILADPDTFEESLCDESVTVVVDCSKDLEGHVHGEKHGPRVLGISKMGGTVIGRTEMRQLVAMAEKRWADWSRTLLVSRSGEKT